MKYESKEVIMLFLTEMESKNTHALNNLEIVRANKDMMELLAKNNLSTKVFDIIREYKIIQSRLKILRTKIEEDKYEIKKLMEESEDLRVNYDSICTQWSELIKSAKEIL